LVSSMPPTWIWMQVAIVVFVLIGMIVAITKLA
jgi:ABC-type multidrug transport system permease subunit